MKRETADDPCRSIRIRVRRETSIQRSIHLLKASAVMERLSSLLIPRVRQIRVVAERHDDIREDSLGVRPEDRRPAFGGKHAVIALSVGVINEYPKMALLTISVSRTAVI